MAVSKEKKASPKTHGPIAVTGGGYKGLHLLRWLDQREDFEKIIFLNPKKPPFPLKKTQFHPIDLTETLVDVKLAEIFKKEKIDTLVHTALPITPPHDLARTHELISVGSMYLCNAASHAKVRKLILTSTADVYGAFPNNPNYITERHPARGGQLSRFLGDKIDAENRFLQYAQKHPRSIVTLLRPTTLLGPTISSFKTRYLSRSFVPTVLGSDPLVQFIHEKDFQEAFQRSVLGDFPGIFNLASRGVIPLSKAIQLMGKINLPLPMLGLKTFIQTLWYLNISPAPAHMLNYLKYLAVVDITKAEGQMGFYPRHSCKEALLDFVGAERLREVHLNKAPSKIAELEG